jgi:hypothetical protein
MVYLVERYLPGLDERALRASLARLPATTKGTPVRYLGSMIVPVDEACFCQFDAPSEDAVADANRRAGIPYDRIVAAVAVPPDAR